MLFRPKVNQSITLQQTNYTFTEHPAAKGMPYGQTGRRATVYQVRDDKQNLFALKVFTLAFREQRNAESAEKLAAYTRLPGMQTCQRSVFTPQRHASLLQQYPDLEYTVLMPWVVGETWQEIMLNKQPLTRDQSQQIAEDFVRILARLEGEGVAHCDLSGPNVMVNLTGNGDENISLVDVEDLYAPGLTQPAKLPGGSAGYAHKTAPQGLWGADADRFGGAVLLAEMLGWCDERLRRIAHSEQYFDPGEMQQSCERYQVLLTVLGERWGSSLAESFVRAWFSQTQADCPTLTEWAKLLGVVDLLSPQERRIQAALQQVESMLEHGQIGRAIAEAERAYGQSPRLAAGVYVRSLLTRGVQSERRGKIQEAISDYQIAYHVAPPGGLRDELGLILAEINAKKTRETLPKSEEKSALLCPHCRKEIQPEWELCPYCTHLLKPTKKQNLSIKKTTRWKRWLIYSSLIIMGLCTLVGGSGWYYVDQRNRQAEAAAQAIAEENKQYAAARAQETLVAISQQTQTAIRYMTEETSKAGKIRISPKDGMEMVYVPAGDFLMGSNDSDSDEKPQHKVYVDAFWIDKTEVTYGMYDKCVAKGVCVSSGIDRNSIDINNSAVEVNEWDSARVYCEFVERRLPTEAEWEKAARGIDGRKYPWGNAEPSCELADYLGCPGLSASTPVGSKLAGASPYGALDMAGSAWEWVDGWLDKNPNGSEYGKAYVIRGGLIDLRRVAQVTVRATIFYNISTSPINFIGIRCAQ